VTIFLIGVAVSAFVVTNIDAFLVMTALFAASSGSRIPLVVVGQVAGFVIVLAMSAAVALGLSSVAASWCGMFGLVPLGLGLHGLWTLRGADDDAGVPRIGLGLLGVAAMMVGNGGDNVAVLAPLFRSLGLAHSIFVSGVLIVLDGAMCAAALRAGNSALMLRVFERAGAVVVPAVYSAIGIALLIRAGSLSSFAWHP
jgi:cadmium resistance protein CadD (predicted permease)